MWKSRLETGQRKRVRIPDPVGTTFHCFRDLPTELKVMVWKYVAHDLRPTVEMRKSGPTRWELSPPGQTRVNYIYDTKDQKEKSQGPSFLHVDKLWRSISLEELSKWTDYLIAWCDEDPQWKPKSISSERSNVLFVYSHVRRFACHTVRKRAGLAKESRFGWRTAISWNGDWHDRPLVSAYVTRQRVVLRKQGGDDFYKRFPGMDPWLD